MTNNCGNTGRKIWYVRTTFVYGRTIFWTLISYGEELFSLKIFRCNTAGNFLDPRFIRQSTFLSQNFPRWYGGQLFGPSFYTGRQLFCLNIFWCDTGVETFWTLILGASNFWTLILYGRITFFRPKNQIFWPVFPQLLDTPLWGMGAQNRFWETK